jgi:hypothetical protein
VDLLGYWNEGLWPFLTELSVLGPLATFFVALAAWRTYRQKSAADARDQWWKRAEWAIGLALREDRQSRLAGLAAMREIQTSAGATAQDERLFGTVSRTIQEEVRVKSAEARFAGYLGFRRWRARQ